MRSTRMLASCASTRKAARDAAKPDAGSGKGASVRRPFKPYAFLFERSIDIETPYRHAEKLREELTLARIDRHSGELEVLDVEGTLGFAERVLPGLVTSGGRRRSNSGSGFQQLFFPDGIAFDGNQFVRTGVTAPAFNYSRESRTRVKVWWPRFSPDGTA